MYTSTFQQRLSIYVECVLDVQSCGSKNLSDGWSGRKDVTRNAPNAQNGHVNAAVVIRLLLPL
jgi:hypothetical protein